MGNTKKSSDSGVLKLRVICKITQPDHYRMAKFCIWVQRTPGVFLFFIISSGVRRIFVGKALRLKDQKYYWTSREIRYPSTDNTKKFSAFKIWTQHFYDMIGEIFHLIMCKIAHEIVSFAFAQTISTCQGFFVFDFP